MVYTVYHCNTRCESTNMFLVWDVPADNAKDHTISNTSQRLQRTLDNCQHYVTWNVQGNIAPMLVQFSTLYLNTGKSTNPDLSHWEQWHLNNYHYYFSRWTWQQGWYLKAFSPSENAMPSTTPKPLMARTSSTLAAAITSVGMPLSSP